MSDDPQTLEETLDRIGSAETRENKVSLDDILDKVGRRSFGPLLLVPGLIIVLPIIGDIPGVPTVMGIFVLLVAGQVLARREHIWLPQWMLKRTVSRQKLDKAIALVRRPVRFVDKLSKKRLTLFINGHSTHVVAATCILVALALPLMEFVPFSANFAGAALIIFGLAQITKDGLLSLIGLLITLGTAIGIPYALLNN